MNKNKIKFKGYYINGIRWNGIGLDENENKIYELKNVRGYIKELDYYYNLIYEGKYANGKKHGKGGGYYLCGLLFKGIYLYDFKKKVKNIMHMDKEFLKVNIYIINNGMEKDMMKMVI